MTGWPTRFDVPIALPDGETLATLSDAPAVICWRCRPGDHMHDGENIEISEGPPAIRSKMKEGPPTEAALLLFLIISLSRKPQAIHNCAGLVGDFHSPFRPCFKVAIKIPDHFAASGGGLFPSGFIVRELVPLIGLPRFLAVSNVDFTKVVEQTGILKTPVPEDDRDGQ
jgi:hypothetical protein